MFELRIGFSNRVVSDDELFRQRANSGQLISVLQRQLSQWHAGSAASVAGEWLPGGWVEGEEQTIAV